MHVPKLILVDHVYGLFDEQIMLGYMAMTNLLPWEWALFHSCSKNKHPRNRHLPRTLVSNYFTIYIDQNTYYSLTHRVCQRSLTFAVIAAIRTVLRMDFHHLKRKQKLSQSISLTDYTQDTP